MKAAGFFLRQLWFVLFSLILLYFVHIKKLHLPPHCVSPDITFCPLLKRKIKEKRQTTSHSDLEDEYEFWRMETNSSNGGHWLRFCCCEHSFENSPARGHEPFGFNHIPLGCFLCFLSTNCFLLGKVSSLFSKLNTQIEIRKISWPFCFCLQKCQAKGHFSNFMLPLPQCISWVSHIYNLLLQHFFSLNLF